MAQQMKRDLLDQLEELAEDLPPNTLDELIDELGGPENVAEVLERHSFSFALCLSSCGRPWALCNLSPRPAPSCR